MKLSKRQREILTTMVEHRDDEKGELVCSIPGGWWLGHDRIAGRTAFWLLRNVLLKKSFLSGEGYEIYHANGYAEQALKDPEWHWSHEIEIEPLL